MMGQRQLRNVSSILLHTLHALDVRIHRCLHTLTFLSLFFSFGSIRISYFSSSETDLDRKTTATTTATNHFFNLQKICFFFDSKFTLFQGFFSSIVRVWTYQRKKRRLKKNTNIIVDRIRDLLLNPWITDLIWRERSSSIHGASCMRASFNAAPYVDTCNIWMYNAHAQYEKWIERREECCFYYLSWMYVWCTKATIHLRTHS